MQQVVARMLRFTGSPSDSESRVETKILGLDSGHRGIQRPYGI